MREYILKQEVVVAQTPKWNFKANTAGNAISEGQGQFFLPDLSQKWQKTQLFSIILL